MKKLVKPVRIVKEDKIQLYTTEGNECSNASYGNCSC